jgi:hypothetical protein
VLHIPVQKSKCPLLAPGDGLRALSSRLPLHVLRCTVDPGFSKNEIQRCDVVWQKSSAILGMICESRTGLEHCFGDGEAPQHAWGETCGESCRK